MMKVGVFMITLLLALLIRPIYLSSQQTVYIGLTGLIKTSQKVFRSLDNKRGKIEEPVNGNIKGYEFIVSGVCNAAANPLPAVLTCGFYIPCLYLCESLNTNRL